MNYKGNIEVYQLRQISWIEYPTKLVQREHHDEAFRWDEPNRSSQGRGLLWKTLWLHSNYNLDNKAFTRSDHKTSDFDATARSINKCKILSLKELKKTLWMFPPKVHAKCKVSQSLMQIEQISLYHSNFIGCPPRDQREQISLNNSTNHCSLSK